MKRLVLTTSNSGAGCLKAARIADAVFGFSHRVVSGPVPAIFDPAAYFVARAEMLSEEGGDGEDAAFAQSFARDWAELSLRAAKFDRVELWIDPVANAQLQFMQLLVWLQSHPDILDKVVIVHADRPVGEQDPKTIAALRTHFHKVDENLLAMARRALRAFSEPTPEAWFDLRQKTSMSLPYLHGAILQLLDELPAAGTALSATERKVLAIVSNGETKASDILAAYLRDEPMPVHDYWEVRGALECLARCPSPALLGLDIGSPCTNARADRTGWENRHLSLSPLGRAMVEGREDFATHNPISRWWGGTKLTNDRLWRWDAVRTALVVPR